MTSIENKEAKKVAKREVLPCNERTDAKASKKSKPSKEETQVQENENITDATLSTLQERKQKHAALNQDLLQKARLCQEKAKTTSKAETTARQANKSIESFEKDIAAETLCRIRNTTEV